MPDHQQLSVTGDIQLIDDVNEYPITLPVGVEHTNSAGSEWAIG